MDSFRPLHRLTAFLVTFALPLLLPAHDFATRSSDLSSMKKAQQLVQEVFSDQVTAFRVQEIAVGERTDQLRTNEAPVSIAR